MARRKIRGRSKYKGRKRKNGADKYGRFDNGRQITADKIAGQTLWYREE